MPQGFEKRSDGGAPVFNDQHAGDLIRGSSGVFTPVPDMKLSRVTDGAGFFAAVYRPEPDPMLRTRPQVQLGPRYRIAWALPTSAGKSTLYQDVYPYAKPYAVTYMRPGQTFYGGMTTQGGWFVGGVELKPAWVRGAETLIRPASVSVSLPPGPATVSVTV